MIYEYLMNAFRSSSRRIAIQRRRIWESHFWKPNHLLFRIHVVICKISIYRIFERSRLRLVYRSLSPTNNTITTGMLALSGKTRNDYHHAWCGWAWQEDKMLVFDKLNHHQLHGHFLVTLTSHRLVGFNSAWLETSLIGSTKYTKHLRIFSMKRIDIDTTKSDHPTGPVTSPELQPLVGLSPTARSLEKWQWENRARARNWKVVPRWKCSFHIYEPSCQRFTAPWRPALWPARKQKAAGPRNNARRSQMGRRR